MTGNIQISTKLNDGTILVVGGDNYADFTTNLFAMLPGEGDAQAVLDSFGNLTPTAAGGGYSEPAQQQAYQALAQGGMVPPPNVPAAPPGVPVAQNYPPQQQYQQAATAMPAVPSCIHGPRTRREGVGKNGRPYVGWFCSTPKGTPDQCSPSFGNS